MLPPGPPTGPPRNAPPGGYPPPPPPGSYPPPPPLGPPPGYGPIPKYAPNPYAVNYGAGPVPPPPPTNSLIRLRPLEIGDLFDESFRIYRRNFTLFAGISVSLVIPALLIQYFLGSFTQLGQSVQIFTSLAQGSRITPPTPPDINWLGLAVSALLNLVLYPFSIGAIALATCELAEGRQPTWGSVFGGLLRNYWKVLAVGLLYAVSGLLICLPPLWVWIAVGWSVAIPALFVENRGVFNTLGRSWNLVEGRWWRTFLLILLVVILLYVVETALGAFATAGLLLGVFLPQVVAGLIVYTLSDVVRALAAPVFYIAIVLIYYDLRVRREGLDLVQQAQSLVRPAAQAPGSLPS